ncbi:MAG: M1 family peptidase [Winogradskyella sp.]|uniref:M1 family metallopeptidase n=1 Tax=Winogradskyella sp. TaxID=1883156 RepID=UPI000F3FAC85|nr:M1 family metallopeptidase [Winogradskyella sp.]RNC86412.1 MAG: M1 family peptidase [Winogradskyella sp.]
MKRLWLVFYFFCGVLVSAQQTDYVDFKKIEADISFFIDSSRVYGYETITFKIIKPTDSIFIDAKNMKLRDLYLKDSPLIEVDFTQDENKIWVKHNFAKDKEYKLFINYKVDPKKALYFLKRKKGPQIWTQGQGKYTSNWLPSIDDVNDKIIFELQILSKDSLKVISNGALTDVESFYKYKRWYYKMKKPMSSYLVALVVGDYDKKVETSKSGIPLEYYYYPEDSLKIEPTYRYTKLMFDFLEDEIGFPYPWQNYKQVPVHDFLYAGMENTSLTIFSDAFMVDSTGFNDKNYVNVNAHELAHQWFGDLVTATSGEHHWLQEGFATYYALLAEKEVFGEDYYMFNLYNSAQELARQDLAGNGTSLLNPKSSSLTFYQRGTWVLHALRDKVGSIVFRTAVKNYLDKHQFTNVETSDFISEVETLYEKPLDDFVAKWIVDKAFPFEDAIEILKRQSIFINEYIMVDCETNSSKCSNYLKYYASDEAKIKVIGQRPDLVSKETFNESLKVRQAIAQYLTKIPEALKGKYEILLDDKSYLTIESALYNLWVNFPLERSKYLNKTKSVIGFNDKNVRLLWLVLALNTLEYESDKNDEYLKELMSYTDPQQHFELRMKAFEYLNLIGACEVNCQNNLRETTKHHNWRMVKFSKAMLEKLNQN